MVSTTLCVTVECDKFGVSCHLVVTQKHMEEGWWKVTRVTKH